MKLLTSKVTFDLARPVIALIGPSIPVIIDSLFFGLLLCQSEGGDLAAVFIVGG